MKLKRLILLVLLAMSAACRHQAEQASNEIEYRGQKIKLSKAYSDYDDYKEDPDNIHPSETARVQRLVIEATIPKRFESVESLSQSMLEIAFPGYGSNLLSQKDGTDRLTGFCVEIPRAEKERCVTFRKAGDAYELIDDFVKDDDSIIFNVSEENGSLVYSGGESAGVITRPLRQ